MNRFQFDSYCQCTIMRSIPGLLSITFAVKDDAQAAAICMVLAIWIEWVLEKIAHLKKWIKGPSQVQADGFSDLVCFVLAPAIFVLTLSNAIWIIVPAILFVCSGIFRLSRFNIEGALEGRYEGLPVTYNGYAFPLASLFISHMGWPSTIAYSLLFATLAYLMSSNKFSTPEI